MNPTSVAYFMIGGPFHGHEVSLPHPVATYNPIVEGNEERYNQIEVNLFGHRLAILAHCSLLDDQRTNEALAHGLLNFTNLYQLWVNSPITYIPPVNPLTQGMDGEARVEESLQP